MAIMNVYISEDTLIEFSGMKDASDDTYINDSTGTWELSTYDNGEPGTSLATGSLSYVAASNGNYQGTIDKGDPSTALTEDTRYILEATVASSGRDGFRRIEVWAIYHSSTP